MGVPGRIGDIQPFARLYEGATTVVYKGYQQALDRFVLLKVLKPVSGGSDLAQRFAAEAQLLARVRHPNVVAIYTYGQEAGQAYLAAEFVDGLSLQALIDRGPVPWPLATYILRAAAAGLQAAHRQDVLHRDLKPDNILVAFDGQVKLVDFGMASLTSAEAAEEVRGTLAYLAPEQVLGAAPTPAADLFSLGATYYEMLRGRPAFTGTTPSDFLAAVLHHDPLPALQADATVPACARRACARLMAKKPEDRYPEVALLLEALDAVLQTAAVRLPTPEELAAFVHDPASYQPPAAAANTMPAAGDAVAGTSSLVPPPEAPAGPAPPPTSPRAPMRRPLSVRWMAAALAVLMVATLGYAGFSAVTGPPPPLAADSLGSSPRFDPRTATMSPPPDAARQAEPPAENTAPGEAAAVMPEPIAAGSPPPPARRLDSATDGTAHGTTGSTFDSTFDSTIDSMGGGMSVREGAQQEAPRMDDEIEANPVDNRLGAVRFAASPWAVVVVDGDSLGVTPFQTAVPLPAGAHDVTLLNPRFPPYRTTVEVAPGDTLDHHVVLWRTVAQLWLDVNPWAEVLVDGAVRDTVPPQEHPLVLTPGRHTLLLRTPAQPPFDTTFTVAAGDTLRLKINLARRRTP